MTVLSVPLMSTARSRLKSPRTRGSRAVLTQEAKVSNFSREPSGDVAQRGAMSDSEDDWETADVPEGTFVKVDSAAIEAAEA
jgi:hypothetical protein